MKDFSKKIVNTIKQEHIVPDSKLKINFKNYLFWFIFSGVLLLGALFFSLIILNIIDLKPDVFRHLKLGRFFFLVFMTLPYLWIGLLAITIFSGLMAFRKTKKGYRYSMLFIAGIIVLFISVVGALAHFSKMNSHFDRSIPGPRGIVHPMEGRWQRPEEGLLGGEIIEVGDQIFFLKTPRGEEWRIFYGIETEIKKDVEIKKNKKVGVLGEKKDDKSMEAFVIIRLPFRGEGKGSDFSESRKCPFLDAPQKECRD